MILNTYSIMEATKHLAVTVKIGMSCLLCDLASMTIGSQRKI